MGYECGDGDYDSLRPYQNRVREQSFYDRRLCLGETPGGRQRRFPPSRRVSDWPNRDGARFIESSAAGIGHQRDKQRLAVAARPNRRGVPGFERLQENTIPTLGKTMMIIMAKDDEDDEEKRKVKHEDVRRERIAKEKKRGPRTRRSGKRREALRHWQGLLLNKCPVTRTGPGTSPGTGQILPLRDTPSQQPRTV
jgi:hypothetical protein